MNYLVEFINNNRFAHVRLLEDSIRMRELNTAEYLINVNEVDNYANAYILAIENNYDKLAEDIKDTYIISNKYIVEGEKIIDGTNTLIQYLKAFEYQYVNNPQRDRILYDKLITYPHSVLTRTVLQLPPNNMTNMIKTIIAK